MWTIARLELLQRVRAVSWYVLLGVFGLILLGVTALSCSPSAGGRAAARASSPAVVCVTLLLALLVSPTLSGNSINGDRDAATLAPVQVTLATTGEILFGKFVAAWITGLAFVAVAAPFLLVAMIAGGTNPAVVVVARRPRRRDRRRRGDRRRALRHPRATALLRRGHLSSRRGAVGRHAHRVRPDRLE
jgi:ABC-type transport system involved in multi-copper enzyme maturation permease subunit